MGPNDKPLWWLRGEVKTPPVFEGSAPRNRLLASAVSAWGKAGDATFETDARDWGALSRITDRGRGLDVAHRLPD